MKNIIHVVAFDIPSPPNYGGVIDVFYKLKHLHNNGWKVHFHCFDYNNRLVSDELNQLCESVELYKRKKYPLIRDLFKPYIVWSRRNKDLLKNLGKIQAPILFDGIHCTYFLNHPELEKRKKLLRLHNIEHQYYGKLALSTRSWKKLYYQLESFLCKGYERKIMNHADWVLPISNCDYNYYQKKNPKLNLSLVGPFHANEVLKGKKGKGKYALYHGNLSVGENDKSAIYLIKTLSCYSEIELVIAGNEPSAEIIKLQENHQFKLISNPSQTELQQLISDAHIHLMHASQKSGIKLKLINSIFQGRFIIANDDMISSDFLRDLVITANSSEEWFNCVKKISSLQFENEHLIQRKRLIGILENEKQINNLIYCIKD